jgi:predicted Zn-dependent protease
VIFLIEYNKDQGRIVTIKSFANSERETAEQERFAREIDLGNQGDRLEIVLLEAETEEALRRTHQRYFEDLDELARLPAA